MRSPSLSLPLTYRTKVICIPEITRQASRRRGPLAGDRAQGQGQHSASCCLPSPSARGGTRGAVTSGVQMTFVHYDQGWWAAG